MSTKTPLAELVLDFDIYPRHKVDAVQVRNLVNAMRSGEKLPPIIADRKSKKVVDGFHRYKAAKQLEAKTIDVEFRDYKREADLLLDSFRLNSKHGVRLSSHDRTRCVLLAKRFKLSNDVVAQALCIPQEVILEILPRKTATVDSEGRLVPIKQSIRHKAGGHLTDDQAAVLPRLGGNNQTFYVNQLIRIIENSLLDVEDEGLMKQLEKLHDLLDGVLAKA